MWRRTEQSLFCNLLGWILIVGEMGQDLSSSNGDPHDSNEFSFLSLMHLLCLEEGVWADFAKTRREKKKPEVQRDATTEFIIKQVTFLQRPR